MTTTTLRLPGRIERLPQLRRIVRGGLAARGAVGAGLAAKAGGAAAVSSLLTGLVAYWKLDETSGTRYDSHGANHLSDTGSVGYTTGKVSNAADFAGGNKLAGTYSALDVNGSNFTVAFWAKWDATDWAHIIGKGQAGWGFQLTEWNLMRYSSLGDHFLLGVVGGNSAMVVKTTTLWQLVIAWFVSGVSINISVDNGTPVSAPTTAVISNTGGAFAVGNASGALAYRTGPLDEIGYWKRVLTPAERTALYNGGAGITYPFTS